MTFIVMSFSDSIYPFLLFCVLLSHSETLLPNMSFWYFLFSWITKLIRVYCKALVSAFYWNKGNFPMDTLLKKMSKISWPLYHMCWNVNKPSLEQILCKSPQMQQVCERKGYFMSRRHSLEDFCWLPCQTEGDLMDQGEAFLTLWMFYKTQNPTKEKASKICSSCLHLGYLKSQVN